MQLNSVSRLNHVAVPLYHLDENGHVKPNTLFHRAIDKMHSRCIEYPFAASRIGDAQSILDVGTVKSDPIWISWLEDLPIEVHAADYDEPSKPFSRIKFHRADIRKIPLPDCTFDKIFAVSVIEHIGLESPQVWSEKKPEVSIEGDLQAVKELARILKPGGQLIMTIPFGLKDGLVLGNQARTYTVYSIRKFESVLKPVEIEYYEYQSKNIATSSTVKKECSGVWRGICKKLAAHYRSRIGQTGNRFHNLDIPGEVTWRNIPLQSTKATNSFHIEGVACGVWVKRK